MTPSTERTRPTTRTNGIDLSAASPRTSGGSALTEVELMWAYGARGEPCVCGGMIYVGHGQRVEVVVAEHNETPLHLDWRMRQ